MTERAQALEAALDEVGQFYWGLERYNHQPFREAMAKLRALAVPPPPPVGSPTTEKPRCRVCGGSGFIAQKQTIDDGYGEVDMCVYCEQEGGSTPVEPAGASEPPSAFTLGQEFVSRVTSSNAPEGPSVIGPIERDEELVTFALELAVATLGAEGCACQPEEPCALCMCKEAVAHLRDTSPAPVSPVEPTPEPPQDGGNPK